MPMSWPVNLRPDCRRCLSLSYPTPCCTRARYIWHKYTSLLAAPHARSRYVAVSKAKFQPVCSKQQTLRGDAALAHGGHHQEEPETFKVLKLLSPKALTSPQPSVRSHQTTKSINSKARLLNGRQPTSLPHAQRLSRASKGFRDLGLRSTHYCLSKSPTRHPWVRGKSVPSTQGRSMLKLQL